VLSVRLETITVLDSSTPSTGSRKGHIQIYALGVGLAAPFPGDRIRACGNLQLPVKPAVPGVFDYADFLANRRVDAVMYTGGVALRDWGDSGRFTWQRWGWRVHQYVVRRFEKSLTPEQTAVMAGLVVGQRPRFHPELKDIFLRSGTMHVLVASGSNVAFVMLMWFIAMRCLRVPNKWALTSSLAPVWIYVLVSGGDAPLVRAAIMGSTLLLSHLLRRWDRPFNALGLAAWIILIANPRSLFDLGFQMSFLTVAGLLLTMPWVESYCRPLPAPIAWPLRVLSTSVVAQMWLVPVGVHSFHYLYPWSIFSNMLVVPAAGLGLPLGIALVAFDAVGPIVRLYAHGLLWLVGFMAAHLGARWWIAPWPPLAVAAYYAVCLSLPKIKTSALARLWSMAGAATFVLSLAMRPSVGNAPFTATWINTGRALATLVETRNDRCLFLPLRATADSNIERVVLPYISTERKSPIRAVITDNPDFKKSRLAQELLDVCAVSTVSVCEAPVIWMRAGGQTLLLTSALTTRVQRYILEHIDKPPDVIAAHFPPNWHWDNDFVVKFKPALIVETGSPRGGDNNSPWPDVPVVVPQKLGLYRWSPATPNDPVH
jgi:ComEC/Rec2-related protein